MIHNIDAIYDHGVLRPIEPLALPEGVRVHLRVEEVISSPTESSDYKAWLDSVAGRWQGEFVRGGEGDEIPTLLERLKDVVGTVDDLPEDSSINLDHYLYGHPKR